MLPCKMVVQEKEANWSHASLLSKKLKKKHKKKRKRKIKSKKIDKMKIK